MTIQLYDTTLRDGTQREGMSLSVEDKLKIAHELDLLGVQFIEGGWPGSNPKDAEFFRRARDEHWQQTTIAAFGSTRRAGAQGRGRREYPRPAGRRHADRDAGRQVFDAACRGRCSKRRSKKTCA